MNEIMLYTDGSVHVQSKIGYGAYLVVTNINLPFDSFKKQVKVKRFEPTSSTKLEIQTLLWALNNIKVEDKKVVIYTDSQNIIGLQGRRERFEKYNYSSKKNEKIANFELYQEFYKIIDQLNCEFIKVKGHKTSKEKDNIDKLFTIVDKASRNALRGNFR